MTLFAKDVLYVNVKHLIGPCPRPPRGVTAPLEQRPVMMHPLSIPEADPTDGKPSYSIAQLAKEFSLTPPNPADRPALD